LAVTDDDAARTDQLLGRFGVSPDAEKLWRLLIETPTADSHEIARRTGLSPANTDTAIEALIIARLVQRSSTPTGVLAIDPALAIESHVGPAERQHFEGLETLSALRAQIPALVDEYSRGRASVEDRPRIEIISALDDIRWQIYLAAEGCKREALNLHHSTTTEGLRDGQPSDIRMIANGVRCRSIVGARELDDPEFYSELEGAHARGELFRTLPEVPTRMLIFDRDLAVVAVDPSDLLHGAMFLRVRSLIDLLVLLFDQMWSAADPVFTASTGSLAPSGRRARTLELMAIGTKDERIARTLGVGVRTVRRDIADLKATLGVSSRAEIVAAAIRKRWL
jgi:DNA-binding CsgD family transcriptional regulator